MIGGGKPLSFLKPLRPDGNRNDPAKAVGAYVGQFDHFNIRNPVPGFAYRIATREPGRVNQLQRIGYQVCHTPDMGSLGTIDFPHLQGQSPDSVQVDRSIVLMRIPTSILSKRRAAKAAKAIEHLRSSPFLTARRPGEETTNEVERPIRFKLPGHGVRSVDGKTR